jgi:hypothetical protein
MSFSSCALTLVVLLQLVASIHGGTAQIRYANSLPQFGNAEVKSFLPMTTLFSSVPGATLTSYINITAPRFSVFTASYSRNVTALSFPYLVEAGKSYSLYTYQAGERYVLNKLITDTCQSTNSTIPMLRTVNLVQYGFAINVYNFSNNALMFSNISYGEASAYYPFPQGDYVVYWNSAFGNKRAIHGNVSHDPYLFPGKTYTYWVFPTVSFIIDDCFPPPARKRSVEAAETAETAETVNPGAFNDAGPAAGSISSFRLKRAVKRQVVQMAAGDANKVEASPN